MCQCFLTSKYKTLEILIKRMLPVSADRVFLLYDSALGHRLTETWAIRSKCIAWTLSETNLLFAQFSSPQSTKTAKSRRKYQSPGPAFPFVCSSPDRCDEWAWLTGIVRSEDWMYFCYSKKQKSMLLQIQCRRFDWHTRWKTIREAFLATILLPFTLRQSGKFASPNFATSAWDCFGITKSGFTEEIHRHRGYYRNTGVGAIRSRLLLDKNTPASQVARSFSRSRLRHSRVVQSTVYFRMRRKTYIRAGNSF